MRYLIIVSKQDPAGVNIYEHLKPVLEGLDNVSVRVIEEDIVDFGEEYIEEDYAIFASKHQSASGEKTLSLHFPGNLGRADFGGVDKGICMSAPLLGKHAFKILYSKGSETDFEITMEATHHGPNLKTPCFFIEIGSKPEQWTDKKAGRIIADTIIDTIKTFQKHEKDIAIGFGGTHYCHYFNKIELESDIAMSHISPKYTEAIDEKLVLNMIASTHGKVNYALLDWKGLKGAQKENLKQIFEKISLPWKKTKEV